MTEETITSRSKTEAPKPGITRRTFLKLSAWAAGSLAVVAAGGRMLTEGLGRLGIPTPWYKRGEVTTTYGYCDMCPWRCGIIVKSVNGTVHKIDGNPADPKSRGMLCARGQAGVSFLYDPDRLKTPMIRTGERGEGKFREATWEEALDYVAAGMRTIGEEYGPESVAFFGHTCGDGWFTEYLPQAWGSPNAARPSSSLCTSPREEAALLTIGRQIGGHEPVDWEHIECITLIGSHIGEDTRNTVMQDFAAARARGAKVIVVDPRFSTVAGKADYWLPIKPGTDTALLLAWMNVLIAEQRFDAAYLAEWAEGFDDLAAHVAGFTPEWAAPITDLSAEQIRATALLMAETLPRSLIVPGRHVTWYGNDTQRMRAVYIVNALLGAYGRRGGMYFSKSPYLDAYPHPPFVVAGGAGGCSAEPGEESAELPLGPSGKARADGVRTTFLRGPTAMQELIPPMISGDPYPIKGLVVYGVNLLHTVPMVERTKEALRKLDLVVAIDVLPQDHIDWADVVLPEATYLERHDDLWAVAHKTPYVAFREPATTPLYDTKPGWWIARELGLRLGLDRYFAWETAEDYLNTRLRSIGLDLDGLREAGGVVVQPGRPYLEDFTDGSPFGTPSGKIQLTSQVLADAGLDPLPVYEPTPEPPDGHFRLLYGRHPAHTFAKTQNTPVLFNLYPENEVWLSTTVARRLGVRHAEYVHLVNAVGTRSGPVRAKVTERIRDDCVFMVHGHGHRSQGLTNAGGRGASDTELQSTYALDPVCGGAGMRVNFVKVERA
jgi:thiosulfate reductase/polysulfide reductase chain A